MANRYIEYVLRIHGNEIYNVEYPSWIGYSFDDEKEITEDVESGNIKLTKIGNRRHHKRELMASAGYSAKNFIDECKSKKNHDEDVNAMALLSGIGPKRIKEDGFQKEIYETFLQFYKLELGEEFGLKKYRTSR